MARESDAAQQRDKSLRGQSGKLRAGVRIRCFDHMFENDEDAYGTILSIGHMKEDGSWLPGCLVLWDDDRDEEWCSMEYLEDKSLNDILE